MDKNSFKKIALQRIREEIPIFNCRRKCFAYKYCKFRKKQDDQCGLLAKFAENYCKLNLNSIRFYNERTLEDYVQSIKNLLDFILQYENWKYLTLDDDSVDWWLGMHGKGNFWSALSFLENLATYLKTYEHLHDFRRDYNYKIIIEGKTDRTILNELNFRLENIFLGTPDNLLDLEGGTNVKNLKLLFKDLRKRGEDYFLLIDGDNQETTEGVRKLQKDGLINQNHIFKFRFCIENAFPVEVIYKSLLELDSNLKNDISLSIIRRIKGRANILNSLQGKLKNKISYNLKDKKTELAKFLIKNFIDYFQGGKGKKSEIYQVLKKLSQEIRLERKKYYL